MADAIGTTLASLKGAYEGTKAVLKLGGSTAIQRQIFELQAQILAAHRLEAHFGHSFADAVRHEPGGLVGHAKHSMELVAGHAFLAGGQEMCSEQPFVKRDV